MFKQLGFLALVCCSMIFVGSCNSEKNPENPAESSELPIGFDRALMDTTVSPCHDFYRFAGGNWMDQNPIPGSESRWSMFNVLTKQNDLKMKAILEALVESQKPFDQGSTEQLTRDLYRAALNTHCIDSIGMDPIQELLNSIRAVQTLAEIPMVIAKLKQQGLGGTFSYHVSIDSKNSGFHIPYLSQGGLGLPDRSYYLKNDPKSEEIRSAYLQYIATVFEFIDPQAHAQSAQWVLDFETRLAEASMPKETMRDPHKTYNKLSYDELLKTYPELNFKDFFETIEGPKVEEVIVSQPDFFAFLNQQLQQTQPEVWKSYLLFNTVNALATYLHSDLEKAHFDFYATTLRGTQSMKPRWEKAVGIVNASLGEPLGKLFVEQHFSPQAKEQVGLMVEALREAFAERIKNLEWMSEQTQAQALIKLDAFQYKIGYPDKWKDFSKLVVKPDALVDNILQINARKFKKMLKKTHKEVDPTEWGMTPQTVNAYYSATRNEIVFPAGILQPPFFDPNADEALNYGAIGAVIGHEFSHGFDDKGSQFDSEGNLYNWWTEQDRVLFLERTEKIVNQFNQFEVFDGIFINGALTQGENIADLAGLTLAYYALKNVKSKQPNPSPSPDGFTWQQRFFLSWSLVWTQNITDQELQQRIVTDPHAPGKYRVLGPLSNMPEFAKAFGCSIHDPMVTKPENRVEIW